jgi:hypothetical protein
MDKNILRYDDFLMEEHFRYIDSLLITESVGDNFASYLRKVFQRIKNLSIEKKKSLDVFK